MLRTRAVALPFSDLLADRNGWQFALPGTPLPSGGQSQPDIFLLYDDGETELHRGPILTPYAQHVGKPPMPHWAWTLATSFEDGKTTMRYERVHAPQNAPNATPLVTQTLPVRDFYRGITLDSNDSARVEAHFEQTRAFCTPKGLAYYGGRAGDHGLTFERCAADLDTDIPTPERLAAKFPEDRAAVAKVKLGVVPFAEVLFHGADVLAFKPGAFVTSNGLWTTHVVSCSMANIAQAIANEVAEADAPL